MKVTVLPVVSYVARDRRTGRTSTQYRVTWRVFPGGVQVTRKRGGFARKGMADQFADVVRRAAIGADGWRFDADFQPVRYMGDGATVWDLTRAFFEVRWPTYRPAQRAKVAPRLNVLRRLLVRSPSAMPAAAAAYLAEVSLRTAIEPPDDQLSDELIGGRKWLVEHSIPLSSLDRSVLMPVWNEFVGGRPHGTARTYWQIVETLIAWGTEAGMITNEPLRGFPQLRREVEAERVSKRDVPSEDEAWNLALACAFTGGAAAGAAVLIAAFGGLRISEMAGLIRSDLRFLPDGRAELSVGRQRQRVTAAYTDDCSTVIVGPTKGRSERSPARELMFKPNVAKVLRAYVDGHCGTDPDSPLLVGRRGAPFCPDTFRQGAFARGVAAAFPAGHRLSHLTPHDLRHAAVSYWIQWEVPHKQCQAWGGWRRLSVMLDVYAEFLPGDSARVEAIMKG